jgi:hypothetical protein
LQKDEITNPPNDSERPAQPTRPDESETAARYRPAPLTYIESIVRRCTIGILVLCIVGSFAYAAGWLSPVTASSAQIVLTSTLTITSADNSKTFSHYRISTTNGPCLVINGASNVTIENFNIGPCGSSGNTNAAHGIHISGGSGINVYDSYIHVETLASGCCDSHDGVLIEGGSTNDTVQGNVVAYSETDIQTFNAANILVTGNFLLNPQGPFPRGEQIQIGSSSNVTVTNNLALSTPDSTLGPAIGTKNSAAILFGQNDHLNPNNRSQPSDNLSFYKTQFADVENNYITGGLDALTPFSGGAQDVSGCGVIVDGDSTTVSNHAIFRNNILVNTGECGIGISSGANQTVIGNKTINLNPNTGGNTADYIWKQYAPPCGPVMLSGNISTLIRSNGYASGYWNGGGCAPVTCDGSNTHIDSCNTFDYGNGRTAYNLLTPIATKLPPPLIPPAPKNCVAVSPYTTQTSMARCY